MASSTATSSGQVSYSVNVPDLSQNVSQALDSVDGQGIGSRIGKGLGGGIRFGLAGLAVSAVSALSTLGDEISSTLGKAISNGFNQLSAADVAKAKMRGLGNDSASVAKAMDNAFSSVQGTAFGVGDAAGVAGKLMAANIAPGKQLESVLKTVGSSATAAGTDMGQMGSIFATAASQVGGVQNDVLSDLEARGIPIYKALADQLGVTADEVFNMAADGKIGFEAFEQAASTASGAISTEMGGTASGSFDTMTASLDRLASKIMEDVFPLIAPLFQEITRWLDEATAKWEPFTVFLGEAWANICGFFQQAWETVLKPIFDAIAAVAIWVFQYILLPAFLVIQLAFAVLAGVLQGIWDAFLKPIFDGIAAVVTWVFQYILVPLFLVAQLAFAVLAGVFLGIWETILLPLFMAIGAIFNWIWLNIIQPIMGHIGLAIQALGAVFNWLYLNVVKPAWDAISNQIRDVWENRIKPTIDTISKVIQTDPKKAFEAARDAIGTAWAGIQELAKKPVRFVVNTVLNGLIDMINVIPGVNLAPIKLPKGFSEGGYTGNLAHTAVAGVVHGNEHVIRAASRRQIERSHPGALDHMNRFGEIPGYATGGLVNPLKKGSYNVSQPFHGGHNGIDLAAAMGTPIMAAADGVATNVGVVHMGGNEVRLQHPSGYATRYSHLSRFAVHEGQSVQQGGVIGYVGSTGMSTGPHLHYMVHTPPGGWSNMTDPAPYLDGSANMLGEAWNPLAGMIDWVAGKVTDAFPEGGMWIDAAAGLAKETAKRAVGLFTPKIGADGSTSASLYDAGGWLQPGVSLVENRTGRPEPILTGSQWEDIGRLAASSGRGGGTRIEINGNVGWDPAELAEETERRQQRSNALAGIGAL